MRESQAESSGLRYFNFYETVWFDQYRLIQMDFCRYMKSVGFQEMNRPRKSSLHVKLSMCTFVMFCVDFGTFLLSSLSSRGRGINSHVVLHSWPCLCPWLFLPFPLSVCWSNYGKSSLSRATPTNGNVTTVDKKRGIRHDKFCCYIIRKECEQDFLSWKRTLSRRDFLKASKDAERF